METYSIQLPNEKAKAYNRISLLILAINMLAFGLMFFKKASLPAYVAAVFMMLIISGTLITFAGKNIALQNKLTVVCIALCSVSWAIAQDWMLAFMMALVAVVSFYTLKKPEIVVSKSGIKYPSFPPKAYPWAMVKQVILKDDVLSIDLAGNGLLQFSLGPGAYNFSVADFNTFCRQHCIATALP